MLGIKRARPKPLAKRDLPRDVLGFLGEGDSIAGTVELRGGLRIDGRIEGSVRSPSTLVIGPSGEVVADDLRVRGLSVSGRVRGKIRVEDRLEIHRGGRVEGTVELGRAGFVIEPGGGFEGTVRIVESDPASPIGPEGPDARGGGVS